MDAHCGIDVVAALVAEAGQNLCPIGIELLGADHRQRGFDALAHVHSIAKHGGRAVLGDRYEGCGLLKWFLPGRQVGRALRAQLGCGQRHEGQADGATDAVGHEFSAREAHARRGGRSLLNQQIEDHGARLRR